MSDITQHCENGVLQLSLNRPQKKNALSQQMYRQLTAAFADPDFDGFPRRVPALSAFVCLSEYDATLPAPVAFGAEDLRAWARGR